MGAGDSTHRRPGRLTTARRLGHCGSVRAAALRPPPHTLELKRPLAYRNQAAAAWLASIFRLMCSPAVIAGKRACSPGETQLGTQAMLWS